MNDTLIHSYFKYPARAFPVQCASDDFDAYPRAQAASAHYHDLENFDQDLMAERCQEIRNYKLSFEKSALNSDSVNTQAKYKTLVLSANSVLQDLEEVRSWQRNPLLYLRIAFSGLDQAMYRQAARGNRLSRTASRLAALPRLFTQARKNLQAVPLRFKFAARTMAEDGTTHLLQLANNKELFPLIEEALQALKTFKNFLEALPEIRDGEVPGPDILDVLDGRFGHKTAPDSLFEQAHNEWRTTLGKLEERAKRIDPNRSWQDIASTPHPDDRQGELISIFKNEIRDLRHFFVHTSLAGLYPDCPLKVASTPIHERSIRTMASYASGLGTDPMEASNFYVSSHGASPEDTRRLGHRFRREAPFIAAHKTYPGHHLTDCYRRLTPCPVASQVELPLFYEGWATFAESLLPEYGYVSSDLEILTYLRRRLWKAAEAMVDVGLHTGHMDYEACLLLLQKAGLNLSEARHQVGLAILNPGYLLCGIIGAGEIEKLRSDYADKLGLRSFYKTMLDAGQMPFHLLRQVFDDQLGNQNTLS